MDKLHLRLILLYCAIATIAFVSPHALTSPYVAPCVWAVLVLTIAWDAWSLAVFLCPDAAPVIRVVASGMLFTILTSLTTTYLGLFSILSVRSQILLVAGITLLTMRLSPSPLILSTPKTRGFALNRLSAVAVGGLTLACLAWVIASRNQVLFIVQDDDNMHYHLPMVAEWILRGSIWPVETELVNPRIFFPGFKESIIAFLSLPMGNEHLGLLGILELPLFGIALYALARDFGTSKTLAIIAATYAVTTAAAITTATIQRNDLLLAISLCISLLFLRLHLREPTRGHAILAGVALGAVAATKYSGVIYVAILLAAIFVESCLGVISKEKKDAWRASFIYVLIAVFISGGPWYVKNLVAFGNPFYPSVISLGDRVIFKGLWNIRDHPAIGWNIRLVTDNFLHWIQAFGVLIPLIVIGPLFLVLLVLAKQKTLASVFMLVFLPVALFGAFLFHPDNLPSFGWHYNLRYAMSWFAIALLAAIAYLPTEKSKERGAFIILGCSVGNVATWTRWWPLLAILTTVAVGIAFFQSKKQAVHFICNERYIRSSCVVVCCLVAFIAFGVNTLRDRLQYTSDYGYRDLPGHRGWGPIVSYVHGKLHGKTILVSGDSEIFPLYGEPFSNRIFVLDDTVSPQNIMRLSELKKADYVVSFVPTKERLEATEFTFGEAIGPALLREFPKRFTIEFESLGGYLLKVQKTRS